MSHRQHAPRRHGEGHRGGISAWWIALGIVILIGAAYLALRPKGGLPSQVQAAQAYEMYQNGALVLDVRTPQEWDEGHIAGSLLIPLDVLPSRTDELPRDRDIVVVCASGVRSTEGALILRQAGIRRVTCLSGGIRAWVVAGYPLEQ